MLVCLKKDLSAQAFEAVLSACQALGYTTNLVGDRRDLLELTPPARGVAPEDSTRIQDLNGVARIIEPGQSGERFAARPGVDPTCVQAGEARFGAGRVSLIAGPCAIETLERTRSIAKQVKAAGATLLRGGAYKPRSSPYSFQGLGHKGLQILAEVKAEVGIGVVTEVLDPREVEAVSKVADMLQVGARSMTNFPLLREVGQAGRPIMLKRSFGATVQEFLFAAEYILAEGQTQVLLCERGVRGFDTVTRNLLDVGAVAHLKAATHLPVLVDPSHAAGRADLVRALARAGLAAGADGLMVEVHPEPGLARSDGRQAVSLDELGAIADDARALAGVLGQTFVEPDALSTSRS